MADKRKTARVARAQEELAKMKELAEGLDLEVEYEAGFNEYQVFRVFDGDQLDPVAVFESVSAHSTLSFLRGVRYALEAVRLGRA